MLAVLSVSSYYLLSFISIRDLWSISVLLMGFLYLSKNAKKGFSPSIDSIMRDCKLKPSYCVTQFVEKYCKLAQCRLRFFRLSCRFIGLCTVNSSHFQATNAHLLTGQMMFWQWWRIWLLDSQRFGFSMYLLPNYRTGNFDFSWMFIQVTLSVQTLQQELQFRFAIGCSLFQFDYARQIWKYCHSGIGKWHQAGQEPKYWTLNR